MHRQIRCSVRGVFSAEVDVIEPHDAEAGRLTVSRVLYFFACWWSQTGLNLLCTRFINCPFELFFTS